MDKASILQAINSANDLELEPVPVPEWETSVYMKTLTGRERDELACWARENADRDVNEMKLVLLSNILCDESGQRLFTEEHELTMLNDKNGRVLMDLFDKAMDKAGIKSVEEAKKKLAANPERVMWFRLALALGMSVSECQQRVSGPEFVEWQAFYLTDFWGEERQDWRNGVLISTVVNMFSGKRAKTYKPVDFMWNKRTYQPRPSGAALAAMLDVIADRQNAAVAKEQQRENRG